MKTMNAVRYYKVSRIVRVAITENMLQQTGGPSTPELLALQIARPALFSPKPNTFEDWSSVEEERS